MGNRRALRVLIVDDEKWFRDELRERLLKLRPTYQVEVAAAFWKSMTRREWLRPGLENNAFLLDSSSPSSFFIPF